MKATVLAETSLYFIFSPGSLCSSNVYRCESGRCRTLPFFLIFFYQNYHYNLKFGITVKNIQAWRPWSSVKSLSRWSWCFAAIYVQYLRRILYTEVLVPLISTRDYLFMIQEYFFQMLHTDGSKTSGLLQQMMITYSFIPLIPVAGIIIFSREKC